MATDDVFTRFVMKNRFEHCQRGDAITVFTRALNNVKETGDDLNTVALRVNEVTAYCDFQYSIVPVGETEVTTFTKLTVRWFSCVYTGEKRESVLSPRSLPQKNDLSR